MKPKSRIAPLIITLLALAAIFAVCFHSLEEIHYLKSFFPHSFSVEQAFYAGLLELVKVVIIALPLVLTIAVCLFWWRNR